MTGYGVRITVTQGLSAKGTFGGLCKGNIVGIG